MRCLLLRLGAFSPSQTAKNRATVGRGALSVHRWLRKGDTWARHYDGGSAGVFAENGWTVASQDGPPQESCAAFPAATLHSAYSAGATTATSVHSDTPRRAVSSRTSAPFRARSEDGGQVSTYFPERTGSRSHAVARQHRTPVCSALQAPSRTAQRGMTPDSPLLGCHTRPAPLATQQQRFITPIRALTNTSEIISSGQQRLAQLVGIGEWRKALEMFHSRRRRQGRLPSVTEARDTIFSSEEKKEEEEFMLLLLWCGYGSAVWDVWRTSTAVQGRLGPPSARLVLLLAIFAHLVESDVARARDMLLLGKVMHVSAAATCSPSNLTDPHDAAFSPSSSTVVALRWRRLFSMWLECTTSSSAVSSDETASIQSNTLKAFLAEALRWFTEEVSASRTPSRARGTENGAKARTTLAMLLLSARAAFSSAEGGREVQWAEAIESCLRELSHASSDDANADTDPPASFSMERGPAWPVPFQGASLTDDVYSLLSELLRRPRSCRTLPRNGREADAPSYVSHPALLQKELPGHALEKRWWWWRKDWAQAEARLSCRPRRRHARRDLDPERPPEICTDALATYQMWFMRLLLHDGDAGTWAAYQAILKQCSALQAQPLRRIEQAEDRRDWVTALRLCLSDDDGDVIPTNPPGGSRAEESALTGVRRAAGDLSADLAAPPPPSFSSPTVGIPWQRRLRKGIAACEAAVPRGAAWEGAIALWCFALRHGDSMPVSSPLANQLKGRHALSASSSAPAAHLSSASPMQRDLGRIFSLLAAATRWREALACFHATPTPYLDDFIVSQVAYALRASASHYDRAVLDLWGAWRCRVGDAAVPTPELTHQLLQAMLHTSVTSQLSVPSLSTASAPTPAAVAAEVATGLLVAAAGQVENTTTAAPTPHQSTPVPLDWVGQRHFIRRIMADRWVGSWADALRVALAGGDVPLLMQLLIRRVPPAVARAPSLKATIKKTLSAEGGVAALSVSERAALFTLWGSEELNEESGSEAAVPTTGSTSRTAAETRAYACRCSLDTEAALDKLLGTE